MTEFLTSSAFLAGFGAGGALIWFCKDKIQQLMIGAKLHAKADAISAAAKAL
jgi:hypothetical protein